MTEAIPRVGVAAIICDGKGRILLGRRTGSHGAGTYQFPGGHLDFGEHHFTCAEREVKEETDLDIKAVDLVAVTNDVFEKEGKHYITLFVWCNMEDLKAEPKIMEPNKCTGWVWMSWDEAKALKGDSQPGETLFLPLQNLLEQKASLEELRPKEAAAK
ncbi:hypothetical protein N3K66_005386 [Trichothecium roseum]|uniref:Uncharacterized protein n=1 Tax=Trichothecium roseum TaxID=47278 RepID=A0ACC0V0C3_9HYPO|nr:hypothetical protein N3K66_005386 [Trichothecium roseum]